VVFAELALVGGLLIGAILWFTEGPRFKTVSHILRNGPRPVRDLDGYRGPVQVEGRAIAGAEGTVTAPLTGSECLAYSYDVEQFGMAGDEGVWKTLDTGMGGVDFGIEDDTGRIAVDPVGAEFHFDDHRETVSPGDEMPDHLATFVAGSPDVEPSGRTLDLRVREVTLGQRQRFTERRLDVGEQVYVYGEATTGPGVEWGSDLVDSQITDSNALPAFVISDTDHRGTAWRIARPALWKVLIGLNTLGIVVVGGGLFLQ
jgi:hypothetical protein